MTSTTPITTTSSSARNNNTEQQEQNNNNNNILRVGIFDPPCNAVCHGCVELIVNLVNSQESWRAIQLTPEDIMLKGLVGQQINVLIIPGGYSHKIAQLLTDDICDQIRQWQTKHHGGYIGICAGALVACSKGRDGKGLVNGVEIIHESFMNRTELEGMVRLAAETNNGVELPSNITSVFQEIKDIKVPYVNGPLMKLTSVTTTHTNEHRNTNTTTSKAHCDAKVWARYDSDLYIEMHGNYLSYDDLESLSREMEMMSSININSPQNNEKIDDNIHSTSSIAISSTKQIRKNERKSQRSLSRLSYSHTSSEEKIWKEGWVCSTCGALHRKNKPKCCGKKKSLHMKQRHSTCKVSGVMKGAAAVVGVQEDIATRTTPTSSGVHRAVLIGPHLELSHYAAHRQ